VCLRVFVSSTTPIALEEGPSLSVRALDPSLASIAALLGPSARELGAHTGCACGFRSSAAAWAGACSRRAELQGLEGALLADERDDLDRGDASRKALAARIHESMREGPVRLYACWWGDESEPPQEAREVTIAHFTDELEPIPERALLTITGA
jgi:hypothetical protein